MMKEEEIHLIVTSPPYWTLKKYDAIEGQLGVIDDYEKFLEELDKVWMRCLNALVPGGRLVVVVGDVCLARRKHERHRIMPLHSSIQEHCRKIGFDLLTPIIWYKIANVRLEVPNGRFLGKPYESNGIIKNDVEYILFMRKPGGYRTPDTVKRVLSILPKDEHHEFFNQIWTIQGALTKYHPAPFPLELAERIVRMFSFVGDTVLDPFLGTGTTLLAAKRWGRNGIGYDVDSKYVKMAYKRLNENLGPLGSKVELMEMDGDGTLEPLLST
jgi:DNA modification methylase